MIFFAERGCKWLVAKKGSQSEGGIKIDNDQIMRSNFFLVSFDGRHESRKCGSHVASQTIP